MHDQENSRRAAEMECEFKKIAQVSVTVQVKIFHKKVIASSSIVLQIP